MNLDKARAAANAASTEELRDTANAREGVDDYNEWNHGILLVNVNIRGIVLEAGDSVLYSSRNPLRSSLRVWSPLVTQTNLFVLPRDHVADLPVPVER